MSAPFVTIAELSDKLGVDAATARGTAVITAACDIVRDEVEQTLYPQGTATVTLDGTGTDALLLKERPVLNAGTVIENGGTLTLDTSYRLKDNGILIRGGSVTAEECPRSYWWPGRQNVEVTYEYGYDIADVPPPLKEVALSIAARLWRNVADGIRSETLGAHRVDFDTSADLTRNEERILRNYKQAYTT